MKAKRSYEIFLLMIVTISVKNSIRLQPASNKMGPMREKYQLLFKSDGLESVYVCFS